MSSDSTTDYSEMEARGGQPKHRPTPAYHTYALGRSHGLDRFASSSLSPTPAQFPIEPAARPVPPPPRFRALALFGRRPHERVDRFDIPASENLHMSVHENSGGKARSGRHPTPGNLILIIERSFEDGCREGCLNMQSCHAGIAEPMKAASRHNH
jgi:hypothetical protein